MYCKECGNEYDNPSANFCLECGVKKENGNNFCQTCGTAKKSPNQDVCLNCGNEFRQTFARNFTENTSDKNKLVYLVLWFFLGGIGGHLFYVGDNGKAVMYIMLSLIGGFLAIFTCGVTALPIAIFLIVDLVNILTDKVRDQNGYVISEWK